MSVALPRQQSGGLNLAGLFAKYADVAIAGAAVMIVGMMVLPLPSWVLDIMLCANIALALSILLVTMYTTAPLQFSSFPSMLLLTTLFRLSLNVTSTRLILLHGEAGGVIHAFGTVVIGGNFIVGVVVFAILIIIQFMVITNGAGRVAEVAARFTLDAMPGKQMAIDADLNAGIITEEDAQRRRKDVAREADFYGAMDGATKFVRGDAVAAIIMIVINVLGGFGVGIFMQKMDIMQALQTYTLLTVGEGLVTQIPALLISTATGLMVTKNGSAQSVGLELISQLTSRPKALMITATVFIMMTFVGGMPKLPLIMAAAFIGTIAYFLTQNEKTAVKDKAKSDKAKETAAQPATPDSMADLIGVDPLAVEIGYGLIMLADPKQGGDLLDRITMVRKQSAMDMGILVPAIRVRDNVQLQPNDYSIKLRGIEVAKGEVIAGQFLAMNPGGNLEKLTGIDTVEPAFGLPATWISESQRMFAEVAGYTVVDPTTVFVTHLTEVIRQHAAELLTRQETQQIIDAAKEDSPAVVAELIGETMGLGDVQKVLQNLLSERVSIRDIIAVFEALADYAPSTKDTSVLTEYVRQRLALGICKQHTDLDGRLRVFSLSPQVEQLVIENVRQTELGTRLILDPKSTERLLIGIRDQMETMSQMGYSPIALCSPRIRMYVRSLVEQNFPMLTVLSYAEIAPGVDVESLGMVTVNYED